MGMVVSRARNTRRGMIMLQNNVELKAGVLS